VHWHSLISLGRRGTVTVMLPQWQMDLKDLSAILIRVEGEKLFELDTKMLNGYKPLSSLLVELITPYQPRK
jgi:hypothetical protein